MARDDEQQPMSSERLAAIRRKQGKAWLNGDPWQADYRFDVADLLAEVERLRAREADLLRIIADHQRHSEEKASGGDGA